MFANGIPGTALAALAGGAILGTATVTKLAVTGRILGISGSIKGALVGGDTSSWRAAFLAGLFSAGAAAAAFAPGAFQTLPATFTVARAAVGGLLVGAGAGMGNGCTSGHGICGMARKSIRSLVYTLTFMASGVAAALLTKSAAALAVIPPTAAPLSSLPAASLLLPAATIALAGLPALLLLSRTLPSTISDIATELWAGATFGLGLTISGMVRPASVVAFLSPGTPVWDPALMMVMGAALLVTFPVFQALLGGKWLQKPVLSMKFDLPMSTTVDMKLLLGGVLFGAGWGISGMCPGPALVAAAATPAPQLLAYLAAMVFGLWGQQFVQV